MKSIRHSCIGAAFIIRTVIPAIGADEGASVLLRRDWPAGQEYQLRCVFDSNIATLNKSGANLGGDVGSKFTNEYKLVVWPLPEKGRMTGLQWTAMAAETRYPGGKSTFDSRQRGAVPRAGAGLGWDAYANSWSYIDENGDVTGKTGTGHGSGFWMASPVPTLSKKEGGFLYYRICALDSLPDKAVPIGHKWSADVRGHHQSVGDVSTTVEFVFLRTETVDQRKCAVLGFQSDLKAAKRMEEDSASTGKQVIIDEARLSGEIRVEVPSGIIVNAAANSVIMSRQKGAPIMQNTTEVMEMTLLSAGAIKPDTPLPPAFRRPVAAVSQNEVRPAQETRPAGPGEVMLRVVTKPNTRVLLTHSVDHAIRMDMMGKNHPSMRIKISDEVEDIVRPGEMPGDVIHEHRRIARRTEAPPEAQGMSYDSRKLEAGEKPRDPGALEDWEATRKLITFLQCGTDGKPVRSWAEGQDAKAPKTPFSSRMMENAVEVKVFDPEHFPKEPVAPGAVWPLKLTMDAVGLADEVAVVGEYKLRSVAKVDGRNMAEVHFSGVMSPADPTAPPQRGSGVMEKGKVEGTYSIDLDRQRWVHRSARNQFTARIQIPGGRQAYRQEIDAGIEQTFHSEDPLPPMP